MRAGTGTISQSLLCKRVGYSLGDRKAIASFIDLNSGCISEMKSTYMNRQTTQFILENILILPLLKGKQKLQSLFEI
jgi:hypothetical protein